MKKIQVLMSTYNGTAYLREQLDSVLGQDCRECGAAQLSLLIRDDGSHDGTWDILEEYKKDYPKQICLIQGENRGVIGSFFELLQRADTDADYYAFSDQDDYWMSDKLSSGIRKLEELDCTVPALYCCRPKYTDAHLKELQGNVKRPPICPSFGNALIENVVTGCTTIINASLRELVMMEIPEFTVMHDRWLYLVASCFGHVVYDETPHICYRQHEGNVVGTKTGRFAEFWERLVRFRRKRHDISRQTREFLRIYGNLQKGELRKFEKDKSVSESLALAENLVDSRHSLRKRVKLLRSGKLCRQRKYDNMVFRVLIFWGIY